MTNSPPSGAAPADLPTPPPLTTKKPADTVLHGCLTGFDLVLILDGGTRTEVRISCDPKTSAVLHPSLRELLGAQVKVAVRRQTDTKKLGGPEFELRRVGEASPAADAAAREAKQ